MRYCTILALAIGGIFTTLSGPVQAETPKSAWPSLNVQGNLESPYLFSCGKIVWVEANPTNVFFVIEKTDKKDQFLDRFYLPIGFARDALIQWGSGQIVGVVYSDPAKDKGVGQYLALPFRKNAPEFRLVQSLIVMPDCRF